MKALVLNAPLDLALKDVPKPLATKGEVLIRTKASTICTSDLNDIDHNPFGIKLPIIIGHEGAGVVEELGEGVTGFAVGDAVVAHPVIPCGACVSCARGLAHLCDDMDHLGIFRNGTFAEYFTIRADRLRKIPKPLTFSQSTLMEPICVCIEALIRANLKADANVLIVGDGPFGVMIARLARAAKPRRIVMLGRHEYRLNLSSADISINEKQVDDPLNAVMLASDNQGYDCAVLAVGSEKAATLAVDALRSRGMLCVFSALPGYTPVDLFKVHVKELNICGSCNDMDCLDEALEKLCDPALCLPALITHEFSLKDWEQAFAKARRGKDSALKVSITFD